MIEQLKITNTKEYIDSLTPYEGVPAQDVEMVDIYDLYTGFFLFKRCNQIYTIKNKYSVYDALISSGDTTIVFEAKGRDCSVTKYNSVILDYKKWLALKEEAKAIQAPLVLYVMYFNDCILIYELDFEKGYAFEEREMQNENSSDSYNVWKDVAYIPYNKAKHIIARKRMQEVTIDQLNRYIEKERNNLKDNTDEK